MGEFVKVLSLPYKNDLFEMQIILPPSKKQFSWIESKMQLSNTRDLTDEQEGYYNIFSLKKGAAATGAEIVLLSSALNERLDIVVDRPFIFVVQDKKNKIPVLVGRVMDPTVKIP